jgi:hypothetical protein
MAVADGFLNQRCFRDAESPPVAACWRAFKLKGAARFLRPFALILTREGCAPPDRFKDVWNWRGWH